MTIEQHQVSLGIGLTQMDIDVVISEKGEA